MTDKNVPEKLSFKKRFSLLQCEIKAEKGQYNSFGKYKYRNNEDILKSLKPLLDKYEFYASQEDEIIQVGERYYVKSKSIIADVHSNGNIACSAFAREPASKKGMDESQITGAASSYARKFSLSGLLGLDDTKDADSMDNSKQPVKPVTKTPFDRIDEITADFDALYQWEEKLAELKKNDKFIASHEKYYKTKMAEFEKSLEEIDLMDTNHN